MYASLPGIDDPFRESAAAKFDSALVEGGVVGGFCAADEAAAFVAQRADWLIVALLQVEQVGVEEVDANEGGRQHWQQQRVGEVVATGEIVELALWLVKL